MTMTDPIADFLTRIRNAVLAKHLLLERALRVVVEISDIECKS